MTALISTALSILAIVLGAIVKYRQSQEHNYNELQEGRKNVCSGNAVAVNSRIDRLLVVSETGNNAGSESNSDDKSISKGLVALGISVDETAGKSGEL